MDGMITLVFRFLAGFLGLYSLLIIIRIMITWFSHAPPGRFVEILSKITDPYLNWWRNKVGLRVGFLDLSPLAGMVALNIAQTICAEISRRGKISPGVILAVILLALWSAVSFLLGFCVIILVLRLIGYFINANIYSPFWRIVDAISKPLLYRVNRIMFRNRLVDYRVGILSAIALFAAVWIGGGFLIRLLAGLLLGLGT